MHTTSTVRDRNKEFGTELLFEEEEIDDPCAQ
jgi:hypothetical protein